MLHLILFLQVNNFMMWYLFMSWYIYRESAHFHNWCHNSVSVFRCSLVLSACDMFCILCLACWRLYGMSLHLYSNSDMFIHVGEKGAQVQIMVNKAVRVWGSQMVGMISVFSGTDFKVFSNICTCMWKVTVSVISSYAFVFPTEIQIITQKLKM